MRRIGLFGGTFDPPHNGHVHIARAFADELCLEKVIFIPAGEPYHKQLTSKTTAIQRLEMVKRTIREDNRFDVSDCDLLRSGPTYTFDTISFFKKMLPQSQLWWLVGMDSLMQLPRWYRYQALLKSVNLAVAARGNTGLESISAPLQKWLHNALTKYSLQSEGNDGGRAFILQADYWPISSTFIRTHWTDGGQDDVPSAVAEYVDHEGLYRA